MDTRRRRSPLRILAPVALIAFGVALAMVISSANKSASGGGTSSSAAQKARDLGTGAKKPTKRRHSSSRGRLPKSIYIVKDGDTLGSISQKVGVPVSRLQELNPNLDQFSLAPGQKLKIR